MPCPVSFAGARDLYEIVVPAMQAMVTAAQGAPGIVAVRQAGAGFCGCLVALVEGSQVQAFVGAVSQTYLADTGIQPDIYPVQASPAAGILTF